MTRARYDLGRVLIDLGYLRTQGKLETDPVIRKGYQKAAAGISRLASHEWEKARNNHKKLPVRGGVGEG